MFTRVRRTLTKSKHRVQKGGALPVRPTPTEMTSWNSYFAKKGADNAEVNRLQEILTNKTQTDYIDCIKNQDLYFGFAMEATYSELFDLAINPTDEAINAAFMEKGISATNYTPYFRLLLDIYKLLYFAVPPPGSKFDTIIKAGPAGLLEMLLNPEQVRNRFISELASIIIMQKHIPTIMSEINNDDIALMRSLRYEASCERNAYELTSNKLRDGFFPWETITAFRTSLGHDKRDTRNGFWFKFLKRCLGTNERKAAELYVYYTAAIYREYDNAEGVTSTLLNRVLTKLLAEAGDQRPIRSSGFSTSISPIGDPKMRPDLPPDFTIDGLSVTSLIQKLKIDALVFISHLCAMIERMEDSIVTEIHHRSEPVD